MARSRFYDDPGALRVAPSRADLVCAIGGRAFVLNDTMLRSGFARVQ